MRGILMGMLVAVTMGAQAQEAVKSVVIATDAPYSNPDVIDSAIVKECGLPNKVSEMMRAAFADAGIEAKAVTDLKPDSGDAVLMVEIPAAVSSGNAFIGHSKSVTISGKLFRSGKQVSAFVATRKSSGGVGFKGSCAVLHRCATTLGKDVAGWLASPVDGAKLGDAR